jgi:antagonist of KipI
VAFLGFTPGFPYLYGLPPALALPRRAAPARWRPAPSPSPTAARASTRPPGPGGWWSLGTTPTPLFDPWRPEPTALLPGDEVRFVPLAGRDGSGGRPSGAAAGRPAAAAARAPPRGASAARTRRHRDRGVARRAVAAGATAPGVGHLGMSQAGALDGRAFVVAARLAGAPLDAPAIELAVPHATLRAERPLLAAWAGGGARLRLEGRVVPTGRPFRWPAGTLLEVRPDPSPAGQALLAVGGGLAPVGGPVGHPSLVGGGSTDVRAGVGGFGRTLLPGDVLALAGTPQPPDPTWTGASGMPPGSPCGCTRDRTARRPPTPR